MNHKFVVAATCAFFSSLTFLAQTLDEGLIAHYKPAITATDLSGNGNDCLSIGETLTEDHWGSPVSAVSFNGVDQYIDVLNSSGFKPVVFPVSISAWVRYYGDHGGGIFLNNYTENHYYGIFFNINAATHTAQISIGDGGECGPQSRKSFTGNTLLNDSQWHLLTAIIRGPEDMSLYLDCSSEPGFYSGTGGDLAYNSGTGKIGVVDAVNFENDDAFLEGDIDEIRFYNRELMPTEICELYSLPETSVFDSDNLNKEINALATPSQIELFLPSNYSAQFVCVYNEVGQEIASADHYFPGLRFSVTSPGIYSVLVSYIFNKELHHTSLKVFVP